MFVRPTWMIPTAFMLLFLLVGEGTRMPIILWGIVPSAIALSVVLWRDFKPRGKYDLQALRDYEDKQELANLAPEVGVFEFEDYLCPYCRTLYSMEYRNCPKCGRARARAGDE